MLYEDMPKIRRDSVLEKALNRSSKIGNLSNDEKVDLVLAAQDGDEQALDRLVVSNLRFCQNHARRMIGMGVELLDLFSEAVLGFIEGVMKYQPKKGTGVLTYLEYWVRRRLISTVCEQSRTIRIPRRSAAKWFNIRSYIQQQEVLGRDVSVDELTEMFDVPRENILALVLAGPGQQSLNETKRDGSGFMEVQDFVLGRDRPDLIEAIDEARWLRGLIDTMLDDREAAILYSYFWEEKNLNEIGKELGFTGERIRQVKVEAFAKLKIAIIKEREAAK